VKLVQRIGLVFLRPRLAAWRYQKRQKSNMSANLGPAAAAGAAAGGAAAAAAAQEAFAEAQRVAAEAAAEAEAEEDVEHAEQLEGACVCVCVVKRVWCACLLVYIEITALQMAQLDSKARLGAARQCCWRGATCCNAPPCLRVAMLSPAAVSPGLTPQR
jgi:hypothetical protein